ncbi:MAG: hypothetical protein KIS87_00335 [Phycisphaeraceae bacterium]|nr:hypothetical protein [Phycisphaeraceae bacterium]
MTYDPQPDLDEGLDPEGPSAADLDRFGGAFVLCPECEFEVYDQAEVCPRCGRALTSLAARKTPWWVILVTAFLLLGLALLFVF